MKRNKSTRWTPGLKKLKAIPIRQPWAWLIVNDYKDFENWIWAANLRGPVLIHAGHSKSDMTPKRSLISNAATASRIARTCIIEADGFIGRIL